jgi:hypothetical protein
VIPAGSLSVIEKFVRSVSFGATISILSLEFSPGEIVAGENDFVPITSVPLTVTLAVARDRFSTP